MIFKKQVLAVCLIAGLCSVNIAAFADAVPSSSSDHKTHDRYYAGISLAGSFSSIKSSFPISPGPGSTLYPAKYVIDRGDTFYMDYGVQAGKILSMNNRWSTHVGLAFYASAPQTIRGDFYSIQDEASPDQSFYYNINSERLMLETNLFYRSQHGFSYFYGFGVGMAHIRTSGLFFTSLIPPSKGQPGKPKTATNTQNHIVASVDAGLDYVITPRWHLDTAFKQQWLGSNIITVENGSGVPSPYQVAPFSPWQIKVSLSYAF
jgi:opacity protein-like surface antigen